MLCPVPADKRGSGAMPRVTRIAPEKAKFPRVLPPPLPDLLARITVEPGKCGGRPRVRGKRLRVADVLDLLAAGASYEEVLADYPFLERDDLSACLAHAARRAEHVVLRSP